MSDARQIIVNQVSVSHLLPMFLIDTHCHLDILEFRANFKHILNAARLAGVQYFVLPGVTRSGWAGIFDLCRQETGLFSAPGLHPMYLAHHTPDHLDELKKTIIEYMPVALGEIGLDYFVKDLNKEIQQELFESQLDIARDAHLPVLLHVRKAYDQVLATLRRKHFKNGGIVHAFSGSFQQAQQFIKLGFGIGVCGTITYDRATKIRRNCAELPQEWLVLETDAPDIIVSQRRNEENNLPEYLYYVLEALARIRDEPIAETAQYTTNNAKRILRLSEQEEPGAGSSGQEQPFAQN